jgi:predicted ribosomally synthesized peptide with SipW-like signal peptide
MRGPHAGPAALDGCPTANKSAVSFSLNRHGHGADSLPGGRSKRRHRRNQAPMIRTGNKLRKGLLTALAVGGLGAVAGLGTFSAFSATTTNSGNSITSGTVKIDQHTGYTTLYSASNKGPGQTTTGCVRVTYSGSLNASAVKLYASSGITNGSNYNLKIERGSGLTTLDNSMSCAGFTASSTAFDNTLDQFPTSYSPSGIEGKASAATWAQNDTVDYRFTITVVDDPTPNAHTTSNASGSHTFTWEARS